MKQVLNRGRVCATVLLAALALAACGGNGGSDGPEETATAAPSGTPAVGRTATPTFGPEGEVNFVLLLRGDVPAGAGDALGAPPEGTVPGADAGSFGRALSHADWTVAGDTEHSGVTGEDGTVRIAGLSPGMYELEVVRTLAGNLVSLRIPFAVGPDGTADVVAEVAPGWVRATSTYFDDGAEVRELFAPGGSHLVTADGRLVEVGDSSRDLTDRDGDGSLEPDFCIDQVWSCEADADCGAGRICGCTSSCPFCEDCGPRVCVPPPAFPPYPCEASGGCALATERCVCVSSCPECDDCLFGVCVPDCAPVAIESIRASGPAQLVVGQRASLAATAVLSDGTQMDVTFLADWDSSDTGVIEVDSWGTAVAVGAGAAAVTASLGDVIGTPWTIEVDERPALTHIYVQNVSCLYPFGAPTDDGGPFVGPPGIPPPGDILPPPGCNQVVRVGGTLRFSALGEFGNGAFFEDITDQVDWALAPAGIGSIEAGLFTASAAGTARLTAALDGVVSDATEIRVVTQPTVVTLSIYPLDWGFPAIDGGPLPVGADVVCWDCGFGLTVLTGDQVGFAATAHYDTGEWEDVSDRVTWRSDAPAIASIDASGRLTAVAAGEAQIEAVLDEVVSNPVGVRVVEEATLLSLSAYPEGTDRVLPRGEQMFFRATGEYDVGFSRDVTEEATWRSSDEAVAGFDEPGALTGRGAGAVDVWAELDGHSSRRIRIEVFATGELDYCDPDRINRDVWSDAFNRVVLESDCAEVGRPGVLALRYTVTEIQPHGGIFDPCLDLYVFDGRQRRVRTLREEGCGEPFLPTGAPEFDEAAPKFQLLAFWDLKDDSGRPVTPGTYTVFGRFFLYYDPVVSIDVTVLQDDGTIPPPPTRVPTRTPSPRTTPVRGVAEVVIGSATAVPGGAARVDVTLTSASAEVAGLQNDIVFDPRLVAAPAAAGHPDCSVAADINKSATAFSFSPTGCTPGVSCDRIRAIVFSLDNVDPIPPGSVLYSCRFGVPDDPTVPAYALGCDEAHAGDPSGRDLPVHCGDGSIEVAGARPSPHSTPTVTPHPPLPPLPPTATPHPPLHDFDLTGPWSVALPSLGLVCPVDVVQTGEMVTIEGDCAGVSGTLMGMVDSAGFLTARGAYPPLCPTLVLTGQVEDDGQSITGSVQCPDIAVPFEAVRREAGLPPTPTPEPPSGTIPPTPTPGKPSVTIQPTPTPTPGDCPPREDVTFDLVVDPPSPRVGDAVTLTFSVHGSGGIPQYTLRGAEPYLDGDTSPRRDSNFGNVVYELVAAQAGATFLELSVTYEIMECGPGGGPIFSWAFATSPPFPVVIGE